MRPLLIALAIANLSGGAYASLEPGFSEPGFSEEGSFDTIEVEPFAFYPSVSAELTFVAERSPVGWGSFDLTAVPEVDEIRVDLLVGMPADDPRWDGCKSMGLVVDGVRQDRKAKWAGLPMRTGVYDAMRVRLTIEDVRDLVFADTAYGEICGERFELSGPDRSALAPFVEQFDQIGTTHGPSAPSPPMELGPDHDFFPEEPLRIPLPA